MGPSECGVGVNYHVLPLLSVGPVFQYERVFAVAGCVSCV